MKNALAAIITLGVVLILVGADAANWSALWIGAVLILAGLLGMCIGYIVTSGSINSAERKRP